MKETENKIVMRQLEMFNMVFQDLWKEYMYDFPRDTKNRFYSYAKDKVSARIFEMNTETHKGKTS